MPEFIQKINLSAGFSSVWHRKENLVNNVKEKDVILAFPQTYSFKRLLINKIIIKKFRLN